MKINGITTTLPLKTSFPPIQPEKPVKKEKIKRIYEDDDFIIDLFVEEKIIRVSIFKNGHYQDEVLIRKDDYIK